MEVATNDKVFSNYYGAGICVVDGSEENSHERKIKYNGGEVEEYWKVIVDGSVEWENRHPDVYKDFLLPWSREIELIYKYTEGAHQWEVNGDGFISEVLWQICELEYMKDNEKKEVFQNLKKIVKLFISDVISDGVRNPYELIRAVVSLDKIKTILESNLYYDSSVTFGCDCGCGGDTIDDEMIAESRRYEEKMATVITKIQKIVIEAMKNQQV